MSERNLQESSEPKVAWQHVPTVTVDGVFGDVRVAGSHRITFGEFILDPSQDAERPMYRPVVSLSLTASALTQVVEYLQRLSSAPASGE